MQKVAVYWTLMEWQWNHGLLVRGNATKIWTSSVYCKDIIGDRWFPIWHFTDNPEESRIKVFVEIYEVDEDCEANLDILLNASEEYMINKQKGKEIIDQVTSSLKNWQEVAIKLQIPKSSIDMFSSRINEKIY